MPDETQESLNNYRALTDSAASGILFNSESGLELKAEEFWGAKGDMVKNTRIQI